MKIKISLLFICSAVLVGCARPSQPETDPAESSNSSTSTVDSSSDTESSLPEKEEEVDTHIEAVEEETGLHIVDNPESILVYVNKKRKLPDGYEPPDLVVPDVRHRYEPGHMETHMRKEAAGALEKLFSGAQENGFELMTISGYRSYERQDIIYTNQVKTNGQEYADKYSARPGTSEHQTGLTMDVRYADDSKESKLDESFGDTATGIWLAEHAHLYGFIIRYPKNKESITGYSYEPWHIRYVGIENATDIFEHSLTLEEYFGYDEWETN